MRRASPSEQGTVLPPALERGIALVEVLLAFVVLTAGIAGGLFWLDVLRDEDADKIYAEHMGALTKAVEAYAKANWSGISAADTTEVYPGGIVPFRDYHTNWLVPVVDDTGMQEGETYTQTYYGLPWRSVLGFVDGDETKSLSPVKEEYVGGLVLTFGGEVFRIGGRWVQDICYTYTNALLADDDAPCVFIEWDAFSGFVALFHLERDVRTEEGELVQETPLRVVITLLQPSSIDSPAPRQNAELETLRAKIAKDMPLYFAGPARYPSGDVHHHAHLSGICRRRGISEMREPCNTIIMRRMRDGIAVAEKPALQWVNWHLRLREFKTP